MSTPVDHLLELQRAATAGAVSPATADWLIQGIERYLCRQDRLDECLNLSGGQGIRRALTKHLMQRRDYHLKQAWETLGAKTPWRRSIALTASVRRFETILWPRWKDRDEPPPGTSDLRRALFLAYRTGCTIPAGVTRLHEICSSLNDVY